MANEEMDTQRDYEDVLRLQIAEGLSELERPPAGQFLSALSCGLNPRSRHVRAVPHGDARHEGL